MAAARNGKRRRETTAHYNGPIQLYRPKCIEVWWPDPQDAEGLSDDQLYFLNLAAGGHNIFLTAPAGCGKTYVIRALRTALRRRGIPYAMTASTGRAALQAHGSTIHSWAGLGCVSPGVEAEAQYLKKVTAAYRGSVNRVRARLCGAAVLILDEVSMITPQLWNRLDIGLRAARKCDRPMGGIQIIAVGDFCQLPPVQPEGETQERLFQSDAWYAANMQAVHLTTSHRQASDADFARLLSEMRRGALTESSYRALVQRQCEGPDTAHALRIPYLHPHRAAVKAFNAEALEKLPRVSPQRRHIFVTVMAFVTTDFTNPIPALKSWSWPIPDERLPPGAPPTQHHTPNSVHFLSNGHDAVCMPHPCMCEDAKEPVRQDGTAASESEYIVEKRRQEAEADGMVRRALARLWAPFADTSHRNYGKAVQMEVEKEFADYHMVLPPGLAPELYRGVRSTVRASGLSSNLYLKDGARVMCTWNLNLDQMCPRNPVATKMLARFMMLRSQFLHKATKQIRPPSADAEEDVQDAYKEFQRLQGMVRIINGSLGTMRGIYVEWDTAPDAHWLLPTVTTYAVLDSAEAQVTWPEDKTTAVQARKLAAASSAVSRTGRGAAVPVRTVGGRTETVKVDAIVCITHTPIRHAWALTVHAAQGATLHTGAVVHMGESLFAPGQAYVAASRVPSLEHLHIDGLQASAVNWVDAPAVEYYDALQKQQHDTGTAAAAVT